MTTTSIAVSRKNLRVFMQKAFEGLVTGQLHDDLSPRSQANGFDWNPGQFASIDGQPEPEPELTAQEVAADRKRQYERDYYAIKRKSKRVNSFSDIGSAKQCQIASDKNHRIVGRSNHRRSA